MMAFASLACGADDESPDMTLPETYEFTSKFDSESSVSYTGQIFRQVLIAELKAEISTIASGVSDDSINPADATALKPGLTKFYEFTSDANGGDMLTISSTPARIQAAFNDISRSGANLKSKIAGQDPEQDLWTSNTTTLVGWSDAVTPHELVDNWFGALSALCHARSEREESAPLGGGIIANCYTTNNGLDYQQLIEKFLLGAVNYSQGTADYLGVSTPGKGLMSDNTDPVGDNNYTALEHAWDEAFGYFGAARNYGAYSDEQLNDKTNIDTNGDGRIDLKQEFNYSTAVNAGKWDFAVREKSAVNFTQEAWDAFRRGRQLITDNREITGDVITQLREERDKAVLAWEKTIVASTIHYINEVLQDIGKIGQSDYSYADHTKHWSEMKGFALSLQFNPTSQVSGVKFAEMHTLMRNAPELGDEFEQTIYRNQLIEARNILRDAYGFSNQNMGDDNGNGGW